LSEVGNDSTKKAALVNQIAESISRLNKAEDFTKQQDYIQRSAQLMKVDEQGLTTLVNKFIRERISKEEKRTQREEQAATDIQTSVPVSDDETIELLFRDEMHERGAVRAMLEFGLKPWDDNKTVADHIFEEIDQNDLTDLIDNKELLKIIDTFRTLYNEGLEPIPRNFLYHEDRKISQLAVSIMDTSYEISPRWKDFYDGPLPNRDDLYKQEVESCFNYLKLRKIKRMILENQQDIEKNLVSDDLLSLLQTHQHLKALEVELTRQIGTVILK
jgi:DNA primase